MSRVTGSLLFLLLAGPCWAQRPQVEQARQLRTPGDAAAPAGPAVSGVSAVEQSSDFGSQVILREARPAQPPFFGQLDLPSYFTTNVGLRKHDEKSDFFFVPSLTVGYRKRFTPSLSFDLRLQTSEFRYQRFTALDFITLEARARVRYRPAAWEHTTFFAAYQFSEYFDTDQRDSFFRSHSAQGGVEQILKEWKSSALEAGLTAQLNWANPREEERDEYRAYLLYSWAATPRLHLEFSYQYSLYFYEGPGDRLDHNHGLWLGAEYRFNDHFGCGASAFAAFNRSSESRFDYNLLNPGVSLNLSVAF
jgi:hypothetical protein